MKEAFSFVTSIMMRELGYNWGEVMSCVREMFSEDLQTGSETESDLFHLKSDDECIGFIKVS